MTRKETDRTIVHITIGPGIEGHAPVKGIHCANDKITLPDGLVRDISERDAIAILENAKWVKLGKSLGQSPGIRTHAYCKAPPAKEAESRAGTKPLNSSKR